MFSPCMFCLQYRLALQLGVEPLGSVDGTGNNANLVQLASLASRVRVAVYTDIGVTETTNDTLDTLASELEGLVSDPSTTPWSKLHYTTLMILLYRPFMRWSFICPSNLSLNLDLTVWNIIYGTSRSTIEWCIGLEDIRTALPSGIYCLNLCAWIQYHSWARRKDATGVDMLRRLAARAEYWCSGSPSSNLNDVCGEQIGKADADSPYSQSLFFSPSPSSQRSHHRLALGREAWILQWEYQTGLRRSQ